MCCQLPVGLVFPVTFWLEAEDIEEEEVGASDLVEVPLFFR